MKKHLLPVCFLFVFTLLNGQTPIPNPPPDDCNKLTNGISTNPVAPVNNQVLTAPNYNGVGVLILLKLKTILIGCQFIFL